MAQLQVIFIDFTQGNFENGGEHKPKLKELYQQYTKELGGKGCAACKKRRVNAKYKGIIKKLLGSNI